MKRVLWINQFANFKGGAERYSFDVANLLKNEGYESSLLYGFESEVDLKFISPFRSCFPMVDIAAQIKSIDPSFIYIQNIKDESIVEHIPKNYLKKTFRFLHDHKLLCPIEHKIHLNGRTCTEKMGYQCLKCLPFIRNGQRGKFFKHREIYSRLMANQNLGGVVVGSKYMKDSLLQLGFSKDKIYQKALFVNNKFPESEIEIPGLPEKYFVVVGSIIKGKGLDLAIEAYREMNEKLPVVVIGEGNFVEYCQKLIKKYQLENEFIFIGKQEHDIAISLIHQAEALLSLSRSPETYNLAAAEAVKIGTPVIASRVGAFQEWLKEGVNGIGFSTCNVDELRACFQEAIDETKTWKEIKSYNSAQNSVKSDLNDYAKFIVNTFEYQSV